MLAFGAIDLRQAGVYQTVMTVDEQRLPSYGHI